MTSIDVFPLAGQFVGKITIDNTIDGKSNGTSDIDTIIILDRSGSMGHNVSRVVRKILPNMLRKLGYAESDNVTIIAFDNTVIAETYTVERLVYSGLHYGGSTYMQGAITEFSKYLGKNKIRLLAISDGDLHDITETVMQASKLSKIMDGKYIINAQAVRLFTSNSQPDTRGLSSVLQFNTISRSGLVDVSSNMSDDIIAAEFARLFEGDGLQSNILLKISNAVICSNPWSAARTDNLRLIQGENTIWFSDIPTDLQINGKSIEVKLHDKLSLDSYATVLKTKLDYYMNHLRVLKVVNSADANTEIQNIVDYFTRVERTFEMSDIGDVKVLAGSGLATRLAHFKDVINRRKKSISTVMAQLANDNNVGRLNSAQQAEYLRNVDVSRNSKGLAKRAIASGTDFDKTARDEVRAMHSHIAELADLVDDEHLTSFYSLDTTLSGIRTTCELVDSGILDDMDVNDILKMLNIVGVACNAQIGDYPDAMTWRVNHIHYGCYVSLSDILMAFVTSGGSDVLVPGSTHKITGVIPLFDDQRVQKFLRKYAPSLLEYTASISMRRVLADVPMTHGYSICAALWQSIEDINKNKTDVTISTFAKLVTTYKTAVGKYFSHIDEHLVDQEDGKSYFLLNNGITNMILPIINLCETGNTKNFPKIMRALYSYEIWQAVKRNYKHKDDYNQIRLDLLHKITGIDYEKYGTPVPPMFENVDNPAIYTGYHIDDELLEDTNKSFWYVDYITLLPQLVAGLRSENPVEYIKNIPKIDEESIKHSLGIDYSLREFKFYNIVQSLVYHTKADRVDVDTNKMKYADLWNSNVADREIRGIMKSQYYNKYNIDLTNKKSEERRIIAGIAVDAICDAKTIEETIQLFQNGVTCGYVTYVIKNSSSLGCIELKNRLLDTSKNIPIRFEKIKILLLGCDSAGNAIFNGGNVLITDIRIFENLYTTNGRQDLWDVIRAEYVSKNKHIYREAPNRHGHSNSKPSYWGLGYETLEKMISMISATEWNEYKTVHPNCCGVDKYKE